MCIRDSLKNGIKDLPFLVRDMQSVWQMQVNHNPSVEQLPTTHAWTSAICVNNDDRAEAKRNDVVNSKIMPELLVSRWDLQEHSTTGPLLWVAYNLNADPVSLAKCNKTLNFRTGRLDTWCNQREIMMQNRRAKGCLLYTSPSPRDA